MEVETPRMTLREFQQEDWPAVAAFSEPVIPEPLARRRVRWFIEDQQQSPRLRHHLAMIVRGQPDVIGQVSLRVDPHDPGQSEVDVEVRPDRRRGGLAAEACGAMLELAFTQLILPRVVMICPAHSAAALGLMRALGFVLVKERTDYIVGGPGEMVIVALTAEAWRARRRMRGDEGPVVV